MSRRIGNDELSCRRLEVAIGDVDGDALLAFGPQPVGKQREIYGTPGTIEAAAPHRRQLVFVYGLGIMQEQADEGGLAVIHASSGGAHEHLFLLEVSNQEVV